MADPQFSNAPPQEREATQRVVSAVEGFEKGIGQNMRTRCIQFYKQYRGFQQFANRWVAAGPRDRDGLLREAKENWGASLHIPLSFRTIETVVPRAIAQMPHLLVFPREEQWQDNVEAVKLLLDAQQQQIDIDLPLQAVMRSGEIYGLGVGKDYWRKETVPRRRQQRRVFRPGYRLGSLTEEVVFDDPMFEDVDVFDFMWDPMGSDLRTCEWLCHRVWMTSAKVLSLVKAGVFDTASARMLTPDYLSSSTERQRYDNVWQERMSASGFSSFAGSNAPRPHEILEFHDGENVHMVLDRKCLVQEGENPCVGEFPFQLYRPTPVQKQMVGIGALEPIEHLQRELDTLRSQRRDAATLALAAGYVYDSGAVRAEDLTFGPNVAIPVEGADPRAAVMPLTRQEVPGSGYQEEQAIRADFDAVSGVQDALQPGTGGPGASTATEAQLLQAAVSARIQLTSRRFEIEVVRNVARMFLYLDQRMITENRPKLRVPEEHGSTPAEQEEAGRWKWFQIGPGELAGEYEIQPEGGSMAARNVPQDRADATQLMNLFGHNPFISPEKPLLRALELCGVKFPKSWLRSQTPPIPAQAIMLLEQAGVDPLVLQQAVIRARKIAAPAQSGEAEGPNASQVSSWISGPAFAGQAAPQNGGAAR